MAIENDTRGWIMAGISGVACCIGACVICVDIVARQFPGMRGFAITESDTFLSASLSLSFGVMLFSGLYSMLPQSKTYFEEAGYSTRAASYLLIGLFLAGVIGIRLLSGVFHKFIPSHVVDCDHTHDEEDLKSGNTGMAEREHHPHHHHHSGSNGHAKTQSSTGVSERTGDTASEGTPLLLNNQSSDVHYVKRVSTAPDLTTSGSRADTFVTAPDSRRSSLIPRSLKRSLTKYLTNQKESCDEDGPCMGFSDPCGMDCFRAVQRRGTNVGHSITTQRQSTLHRDATDVTRLSVVPQSGLDAHDQLDPAVSDGSQFVPGVDTRESSHPLQSPSSFKRQASADNNHLSQCHPPHKSSRRGSALSHSHSIENTDHHHHVPTNAFMSLGLQTSLAIALHKLPEGFITYATNHANPTLGFSIFMALFIHNLTEGFAMSLPLYLALNSRAKAIVWSSLLGGVSQPLGAAIAALWFKVAQGSNMAPSEGVYGGMFAVTAGVMTSVALTLYAESLQLSHSKATCIVFAFLGMGILGFSYALTAA